MSGSRKPGVSRRALFGAAAAGWVAREPPRNALAAEVPGAATAVGRTNDAPAAGPDEVLDLWPDGVPGADGVTVTEELVARPPPPGLLDRIVRGVRRPLLELFRAASPHGGAVLLVPGGGYRHVVVDKEGHETARWLAARGFTVGVLRYRLPGDGWQAGADAPLQDAQRALRRMRGEAARLGIDPARLGVQGFSAGGHLAARLAFEPTLATYQPRAACDSLPARPDFAALLYPVVTMRLPDAHRGSRERLLGVQPDAALEARYSVEELVPAGAPPVFLVHAADDIAVPVGNALRLYDALRRARVPAEMHLFAEGGHGFGLRYVAGKPVAAWPTLFQAWAERGGFLHDAP